MNYKEMSEAIIKEIGGKENVGSLTHCVTRLRFVVVSEEKVNIEGLKAIEGVINVIISSGQYQVILGPIVTDVYNAVMQIIGKEVGEVKKTEVKDKSIKGLAKQALDTLIACFVPAISAIAGAGMIKVLATLLTFSGLLSADSQTIAILNVIGDGIFYFLPFIVAINAAKKMNVDLFLAVSLAAIVMHPNLSAMGETGTTVSFFGVGLKIMNYSAQALPMIFGIWLLKYVDRFADKVSPDLVKVFLKPMISLLIVAPIVLIVIGPVAIYLSDLFFQLCLFMQSWGWLAVGINAVLFPIMVLTGTHNATIPLIVQMFASQGFDAIFLPSGMAANIAQAGAACAVAVKTKNKELRGTAYSATLSALLGITEPALYGVNLRMKKPFISVLIGAFLGGSIIGLVGLSAPSFVTPSLLTIAVFAGHSHFLLGLMTVPLTFIITFVVTYIMGFDDLPATKA